jgi:SAM-dependent methyltransferase
MVQAFDDIATLYDAVYARKNYSATARKLARWAKKVRRHPRVYDVGSGTGRLGVQLQKQGLDVLGIEPSSGMSQIGLRRGVMYLPYRIQDIPIHDGRLPRDMVICSFDVLDYVIGITEFKRALQKINALLVMGGYLFVEGWNKDTMRDVYEFHRKIEFKGGFRTSETTYSPQRDVFDVQFTYWKYDTALPVIETHTLSPWFGRNVSWMSYCGFDPVEVKADKYSVKAIFKKVGNGI